MIITNKYNIDFIDNVKHFPLNITFTRAIPIETNPFLFLLIAVKNRWEGTTLLKPERKEQHE